MKSMFIINCPECKTRIRYFPNSFKEWRGGKRKCSGCGAWIVLSNYMSFISFWGIYVLILSGLWAAFKHLIFLTFSLHTGAYHKWAGLIFVVLIALILTPIIPIIFPKWRVVKNKPKDSTEIRKSKKILISLVLIIIGVIIGVFGVFIFIFPHSQAFREIKEMVEIAPIEHLVYDIYKTGDYKSSVVALNCLIEKLEMYTKYATKSSNREMFTEDQALSHARLFLVYEKNGKQDLANQEYQKAVNLFGKEYGIKSKEQLKKIMERFDAIKVKP